MKKLLFAAAFAVLGFTANAQEEQTFGFAKGDIFMTGSVGFGSESTGDLKTNVFTIAPKAAYFVSDNIAVGLGLGFTSGKEENGLAEEKVNVFGVDAFGRYYFTPANQFSLFAELGLGYDSVNYETTAGGTTVDSDSAQFGANLGAGLNYFVSSHFSIEAGVAVLGYSTNDNGGNGAESTDSFSFGGDWTNVTFGVNYKF
jgi:opacity protein-like surface antigen